MFKGTMTKIADAAQSVQHLLVKFGSDADHIAVAGVADAPVGVCNDTPSINEHTNVLLLGSAQESITMVASDAIAVGARVFAAAGGKVSALPDPAAEATDYYCVGVALEAAAEDGDEIQVDPCIPFTVAVAAAG